MIIHYPMVKFSVLLHNLFQYFRDDWKRLIGLKLETTFWYKRNMGWLEVIENSFLIQNTVKSIDEVYIFVIDGDRPGEYFLNIQYGLLLDPGDFLLIRDKIFSTSLTLTFMGDPAKRQIWFIITVIRSKKSILIEKVYFS